MTVISIPAAQKVLIDSLHRQEVRYATATRLIERLSSASSVSDPSYQKTLIALQSTLTDIRTAGVEVDAAKSAYEADNQPRSFQLTEALQQQESLLRTFLKQLDELKGSFETGRSTVQSRLDSQTARRSMHTAYRQSIRTGQ